MTTNHLLEKPSIATVGIALAAAISVISTEGKFDLWDFVIGLTLVLLLVALETQEFAVITKEYVTYAAIWGLCLIPLFGFIVELIFNKWISEYDPILVQQLPTVAVWFLFSIGAFIVTKWVRPTKFWKRLFGGRS